MPAVWSAPSKEAFKASHWRKGYYTRLKEIRQVIRGLGGEQTVILSTHILPEVTMTCQRVVIINEGQVVAQDDIENLTTGLGQTETLLLRVARDAETLQERIAGVPGVSRVQRDADGGFEVQLESGGDARERLAAEVVSSGAGLVEMSSKMATLEEVFLRLVTEEQPEEAKA